MIKRIRSQRGDTILEVLIAMTVLSLILVISLALSNRSSQGVRQSQERGEASRQTEGQIELLKKYLSDTASASLVPEGGRFCINPATGQPTGSISGINNDAQAEVTTNFAAFNSFPECKSGTNPDNSYYTYIERGRTGQIPDQYTFTAHTRWYKVTGTGIDEATIVHKIYPDIASSDGGSVEGGGCPLADYERNPFGNCVPCPTGYSNPIGSLTPCSPIPPRVRVVVNRIQPTGAFNPTPGCSTTGVPRAAVPITLSGPGNPGVSSSTALYTVQGFSSVYTATYTLPAGHLPCGSQTQSVTTTPIGTPASPPADNNVRTINFYIRPNCNIEIRQWQDLGSWQPVYGNVLVGTWWGHPGPDWGPFGPAAPNSGPPNPRYAIGSFKTGFPPQHWEGAYPNRVRYDLHHVNPTYGGWYNRFQEYPIWNWQIVGWTWAPNWQNVLIGYGCPP